MHSKNFDKVKYYYNLIVNGERVWGKDRIRNAVVKGMITTEEYEEIVGEPYEVEA